MNIEENILGCKTGDRKAQQTFFMQYSRYLYGIILRYTGDEFISKDVLQEVFILIFKALVRFEYQNEAKLKSWMKTIVIRETIRHMKRNKWEPDELTEGLKELSSSQTESILTKFNQEDLLSLLKELPEGYRVIFNMYAIEGFNHQEIAKELKITESTSRSQLTRARKLLQQLTLKMWNDGK